ALAYHDKAVAIGREQGSQHTLNAVHGAARCLFALKRFGEAQARAREALVILSGQAEGTSDEQGAAARSNFRGVADAGMRSAAACGDVAGFSFFAESCRA